MKKIYLLIVACGLVSSLFISYQRIKEENSNKIVALCAPFKDLETDPPVQLNSLAIEDHSLLSLIKRKGRLPVLRVENEEKYEVISLPENSIIVFQGQEALGWPDRIDKIARIMSQKNITLGWIEFSPQAGLYELIKKGELDHIRVHSIKKKERIKQSRIIPRVMRAVRERKARIIYLNFPPLVHDILPGILKALKNAGYNLGKPHPFSFKTPSNLLILFSAAGAVALLFFLFSPLKLIYGILIFFTCLVIAHFQPEIFVLGFLALFPFACGIYLERKIPQKAPACQNGVAGRQNHREGRKNFTISAEFLRSLRIFCSLILLSLAAAFLFSSLISRPDYLAGIRFSRGVKITLVIPIILWLFHILPKEPRMVQPRSLFLRLIFFLFIFYFLILRTGSYGFQIPLEKEIRLILERIFGVRPRFKEFLIGWPLMILSLKYHKVWKPLFLGGMLAIISLLNSFLHLHTPLLVTLQRVGWGIALGSVLGFILVRALKKSSTPPQRAQNIR